MRIGARSAVFCALAALYGHAAAAQGRSLTLAEVLARAREQAPEVIDARLALDEARGRLAGAALRQQSNPQIDAALGSRSGSDRRTTDFELGLGQAFEPGSRRSARVAGANAAIAIAAANIDEVTRAVQRDAAVAYYRALHEHERIQLLSAAHDLAARVHATADRRYKAGDIAVLDVNVARASLARVKADREGAEASRARALGELRRLLRLEDLAGVQGSLAVSGPADLNAALQAAALRPELRALAAAAQEAESEVQLGVSLAKPDYGVAVRYAREGGDQIVLGGMTVTLPVFSKGQEQRAAGSARAARRRTELEAATARVLMDVRAAHETYVRRLSAVRVLETEAIPGLDENEQLTTRSFEVGQLGLPELLLIRREILDTRFQYLDALLEAALARIELDASAAILR